MPNVTIRRSWRVDDVLTDVTSMVLSDDTGTYGIKRDDTDATVIADGTALTKISTGVYEYVFAATAGLSYTAFVEVSYGGQSYWFQHDIPTVQADGTYTGGWATLEDLRERLTEYGLDWHVDVDTIDSDGDSSELNRYAVPSLEYADALVDEAVLQFVGSTTRPTNAWCRDRSVDIAAYRVFSLGGRVVPDSIVEAYQLSLSRLEMAREKRLRVPGLTYVSEVLASGRKHRGVPLVAN